MHEILAGMSTHIIQLFQGLCSDGLWKYGVFWSFKSETNGWILTWGDGYVNKMIEDTQMGDLSAGPTVHKNQIIPSSCCNKSYPFCPIEAALMRMPSHLYPLGEGIIGKVALTGQHYWISANELCSTAMHMYQEDWQLQFAAGIKTVLLVPVVPHGVLQLGSLDTVFECAALVALIKDMFHKLCDSSVSHASLSTGSAYSNNLRLPTAIVSINHPDVNLIDSSGQILNVDHHSLTNPFSTSEVPTLEDITIGSYRTTSPTDWPSGLLDDIGTIGHENFEGFSLTDIAHWNLENTHGSTIVLNDGVMISNTSIHSEFHRDLMVMSREEQELFMWHCRLKQQELTSPALPQVNGNNADFYVQLETNTYAELLLDTIIDQIGHTSNSESSPSTDSPFSCEIQVKKEDHSLRVDESSISDIPGGQELSLVSMNEGFISCAMTDGHMEINKTITEECLVESMNGINSAEIKRRCRKVELQGLRPRDRQLIQDRMKGLKELIPNASKCSIDALLDKTVAYMLFLQSVSEKAEKIQNILEDNESHNETKKQLESCPLRVEELKGHLLIEMLCEDYEVFLEMAHVLKGLKLTVLKGVLERHSDKLRARFVIEGSDGFNQMQILCPLMHLLRRR